VADLFLLKLSIASNFIRNPTEKEHIRWQLRETFTMIKQLSKAYLYRAISLALLILFITPIHSCSNIENVEPVYVMVEEPIKIDFEEIQNRGTIRMITRYSPTSYFLLEGMDRGFEYELVSRFAKENDLKVEVVLIGLHEDPLNYLENGQGDLIADHLAINKDQMDQVIFSTPYNFINQVYDINKAEITNVSEFNFSIDDWVLNETHQFKAETLNIGGVLSGKTIAKPTGIAWATRKNAPVLKQKMDDFIGKHIQVHEQDGHIRRSAYLNNLRNRYFDRDRLESRYQDRAYDVIYSGNLSPYDEMVKSIAAEAGVDWKLVLAVMAQESAFDPHAESIAGALGLMQIIPRFSKVTDKTELYDPEINIREGVRYLKKHLLREAHLDSLNRHSMALAAYNVGMGNLADARELAIMLGKDPDDWPNIADALLKLMHPEYYQHARYGYKKGTETINYVEDVLNRYSRYQAVYKFASLFDERNNQEMLAQRL